METFVKGSSKMQIIAALLANIPAFIYGVQIGWLSPMAPILQSMATSGNASLSDDVITWMAAALPMAAIPTVPFFIFISDYLGRKKSIIILSIFSSISWILKISCITPAGLICGRALAGMAASGCFLVVPVYVKEISEDSLRGALGSMLMTSCNVGVIVVYVVGMCASYYVNQVIYLGISLLHVAVFVFMPESPAFLVTHHLDEEAAKVISWLRGLEETDKSVEEAVEHLKEEETQCRMASDITWMETLKDKVILRPLVLCLIVIGVQTLSGCFAIVNYAAAIFERSGSYWSPNLLALLVGTLQLAGSLVATATVERFGRKILLATSSFITSACMITLATVFLLGPNGTPGWMPVLAVSVCIFSYAAGLAPVPFILMAEVFSFQLRARLVGVVMMFSWTNSTLTVLLFSTITKVFGDHVIFYAFGAITLFGTLYTVLVVPETKGKSLDDIQKRFLGKRK